MSVRRDVAYTSRLTGATSAHVSGAVVLSLVAWRHQRHLMYLLVPTTGSVMIATVYGRFHYVLDTLAGAALAIAVVAAYRYLCGDGPREQSACDGDRLPAAN